MDEGPTWVKVAYVIFRFFRVIPIKCITIPASELYYAVRTTCVESGRAIRKLPRRTKSYLLGQVPAGIYRTLTHDLRQALLLTVKLHAVLSLNWPLILARRLAAGAARTRSACTQVLIISLHVATVLHYLL